MKKIFLLIAMVGGLLALLPSCKKSVLDRPLEVEVKDSTIFSRINLVSEFVTDIYATLPNGYNDFAGTMSETATDDARHANPTNDSYRFTTNSWNRTINPDDRWTLFYAGIRKCNIFFSKIDQVKLLDHQYDIVLDGITATLQKSRLIGEVYFLRAYFYFELAKRYGGVPIINQVLTLNDDLKTPRNAFDETIAQITKDCDSAYNRLVGTYLSATGGVNQPLYYGRTTKWAAQALKARVLLYAASPLHNPSGDLAKWTKAYEAAAPFFGGTTVPVFSLPNGISAYETLFRGNTATNTEIIWSRVGANSNFLEFANYPIGFDGVTGGVNPSQNLVDAYEMSNGLPISNPASGYKTDSPYVRRDPRFAVTINFNGATYKARAVETFDGGLDGAQKNNGSLTGYYMKKHLDPSLNLTTGNSSQHNWIFFRLAEMLLNYAEARNEVDGAVSDVYAAVNRIRTRVGMPNLPTGLSKDQMRERIRNERRIELAFEGHRFWDARRWDIAKTVFNGSLLGMRVIKNGTTFVYTPYTIENRVFLPYMNLYPIQEATRLANPNLEQNPGW